jgi:hypothetical protein
MDKLLERHVRIIGMKAQCFRGNACGDDAKGHRLENGSSADVATHGVVGLSEAKREEKTSPDAMRTGRFFKWNIVFLATRLSKAL